ncbi:hypothetical protein BJV74DRAFT_852352 [Russula compacta]|nr:hypothetical protein BJV74DRAFT_852352 [Russula compacta]
MDNLIGCIGVDDEISSFQNPMSLPRSNPLRAQFVEPLAMSRFARHAFSNQPNDLEQSILYFTEAIFLPNALDEDGKPVDVIKVFYFLAGAIFQRAEKRQRPEDIRCCIKYLRYLRGQCSEVLNSPRYAVKELLVRAMAIQVEMEPENAVQDIDEMADLCCQLLNSDTRYAEVVDTHVGGVNGNVLSKEVVKCLQKAQMRLPDQDDVSIVLAKCLFKRFMAAPSDDDYKEGMAILDKIIVFRGPGDTPSLYRERALKLAGMFAKIRFELQPSNKHLEDAISRIRARLNGTSLDDPLRPTVAASLSQLEGHRAQGVRITKSNLLVLPRNSEPPKPPSFPDATASHTKSNTVKPPTVATLAKHTNTPRPATIKGRSRSNQGRASTTLSKNSVPPKKMKNLFRCLSCVSGV